MFIWIDIIQIKFYRITRIERGRTTALDKMFSSLKFSAVHGKKLLRKLSRPL